MSIQPSSAGSPTSSTFFLRRFVDELERVHPSLTGEDRIRSGLLARLLLVTISVGALLVALIIGLFPDQLLILDTQFVVIGLVCMEWVEQPIRNAAKTTRPAAQTNSARTVL